MRILLFVAAILGILTTGAFAQDGWVAAKVKQPARYTLDSQTWNDIRPGISIPKASWIHVGPRGRLLLRRGRESISYKSNTLAAVIQKTRGRKTEIRQQIGDLTIDVDKRAQPHLEVKTPFLAAVVKGTKFTTKTGHHGTKLKVERGSVQVTRQDSGERTDVNDRQSVDVDVTKSRPLRVRGPGPKAAVVQVTPTRPAVAPIRPVNRVPVRVQPVAATEAQRPGSRRATQSQGEGSSNGPSNIMTIVAGNPTAAPVTAPAPAPITNPTPSPNPNTTPAPTPNPVPAAGPVTTPAPAPSAPPATTPETTPSTTPATTPDTNSQPTAPSNPPANGGGNNGNANGGGNGNAGGNGGGNNNDND
ncbi:MAG: FecR domain-containing protein, partial [Pseudomonadota bacterium]